MKTKETPEIIGQRVEYQASGTLYSGRIVDKCRVLGRNQDAGKEFDLYIIRSDNNQVFKISPAAVTKILEG